MKRPSSVVSAGWTKSWAESGNKTCLDPHWLACTVRNRNQGGELRNKARPKHLWCGVVFTSSVLLSLYTPYILSHTLHTTETLQWEDNVDPCFKERWWRECGVEEEGEWGRRVRLFYHIFYGEGYVIRPGGQYQRDADNKPFAGKCSHQ